MVIFDERGVRIFLRDGKYFMESDMGHFAEEYVEIEISKEDAEKERHVRRNIWDFHMCRWQMR